MAQFIASQAFRHFVSIRKGSKRAIAAHPASFVKKSRQASSTAQESRTSLRSATGEQRKSFTDKSNGTIRSRRASKDDSKASNIGLRAGSSIIKQSSSNLVAKNQSQTRRKSATSNASITLSKKGSKMKSKTSTLLIPEMVPEHAEAWTSYVRDRFTEYRDFISLYEVNENATRAVYKAYLDDVNALQDAVLKFEKSKNDLMLSRMTRDYQDVLRVDSEPTDFEITCLINAEKIENELLQRREAVLKSQAELRIHVDVCKSIKRDVKNAFEDYCKEKYQMPVEDVGGGGVDRELMDAEQMILHEERELESHEEAKAQEEPSTSFTTEYERALLFESMKLLITREFRKKNLYKEKHNDWKKVYKIERQK